MQGPLLLSTKDVADLLGCSCRTVHELADQGRMPPPVSLGELMRWPRPILQRWVEMGCPPRHKESGPCT